jgi:hypothetical protein
VIPVDGTISLGKVTLSGTPGAGTSYAFDVLLNGVSAMSFTVSDTATEAEDTTSVINVVAGDRVVIRTTPSGTPTTRRAYFTFKWTSASAIFMQHHGGVSLNATTTRYNRFGSVHGSWNTSLLGRTEVWAIDATMSSWRVDLIAAPGAGRSYTFTLMKNGVAEASSAITIADTDTSGTASMAIATTAGTTWAVRCVPAGTPTVTQASWSAAYTPTTQGQWNVSGQTTSDSPDPGYEWLFGQLSWDSLLATAERQFVVATGSISPRVLSMVYNLDIAPPVGESFTVNLLKNSVPSGLGVTIAEGELTGSAIGNVSYTDDDTIALERTGWIGDGTGNAIDRWAFVLGS